MSALDDVLFAAHLAATGGTAAARAELALLRRCRELLVRVVLERGSDSGPWWHHLEADGCRCCSGLPERDARGHVAVIVHDPWCPAVEIDAIVLELEPERFRDKWGPCDDDPNAEWDELP